MVAAVASVGCGGTPSQSTSTVSPSTTTVSNVTYAAYADAGKAVYSGHCAKCHGDQGQGITGPVLVGPTASLTKYSTAQGLLSFISTAMPLDAPGSLSHQEYLQLVSLVLVWNNYAAGSATFSESALGSLPLK
jgi:alcohol dehydrogenase (cytochrome c)